MSDERWRPLIEQVFNKQVTREQLDEGAPTFANTIARKIRNDKLQLTLPDVSSAHDTESKVFLLCPIDDIEYDRSFEQLKSEFANMRRKCGDCKSKFSRSGEGGEPFWDFCEGDPLMLLIHEIEAAGNSLDFFDRGLADGLGVDSSVFQEEDDLEVVRDLSSSDGAAFILSLIHI